MGALMLITGLSSSLFWLIASCLSHGVDWRPNTRSKPSPPSPRLSQPQPLA